MSGASARDVCVYARSEGTNGTYLLPFEKLFPDFEIWVTRRENWEDGDSSYCLNNVDVPPSLYILRNKRTVFCTTVWGIVSSAFSPTLKMITSL